MDLVEVVVEDLDLEAEVALEEDSMEVVLRAAILVARTCTRRNTDVVIPSNSQATEPPHPKVCIHDDGQSDVGLMIVQVTRRPSTDIPTLRSSLKCTSSLPRAAEATKPCFSAR